MVLPLAGRCIWLTRPAGRMEGWASGLEAAGARVLRESLLVIEPPRDERLALGRLAAAQTADIVIATSAYAVEAAWRLRPDFAPKGQLFAVGRGSGAALAAHSGRPAQTPERFDSEGLLSLPALAAARVDGRNVALLGGEGGRTALADTLGARGARVNRLALYRRRPAAIAPERLAELLDAADAVVVTSGESLAHLVALAGERFSARLAAIRLVAPSVRVVKQSGSGLVWTCPPVVVDRMSGEDVAAALVRLWQGHAD